MGQGARSTGGSVLEENGIRVRTVTGVLACALPILSLPAAVVGALGNGRVAVAGGAGGRSEERRVGKECGGGGTQDGDNVTVARCREPGRAPRLTVTGQDVASGHADAVTGAVGRVHG